MRRFNPGNLDQSRGEQHVLVADADVQGDAKDWWYRAAELDDPLPFDVMSAAPADITHLRGINDRLDDPVDWVLIDSVERACTRPSGLCLRIPRTGWPMNHRRYCHTISSSQTLLWRLACIGRKRMKAEWISFFRLLPVPVAGP